MDCCGMPMAAWPGGGYVCRRCQAKVGVSWRRDPNPFARAVEEPVEQDMEPVRVVPVVEPRMSAAEIQAGRDPLDMASKMSETVPVGPGLAVDVVAAEPVAEKFHVGEPKVSGIGRGGGRKGGSK